jgi:hypothetical protein
MDLSEILFWESLTRDGIIFTAGILVGILASLAVIGTELARRRHGNKSGSHQIMVE